MEQEERKELLSAVEAIARKYAIMGGGVVSAWILVSTILLTLYLGKMAAPATATVTVEAADAKALPAVQNTVPPDVPDPLDGETPVDSKADMDDILADMMNGSAPEEKPAGKSTDQIREDVRSHVETFQTLFFNVDPEPAALKASMSKALACADKSAEDYYKGLQERNYYEKLRSMGARQTISITSVKVSGEDEPWLAETAGVLTVDRSQGKTLYEYSSSCSVVRRGEDGYLVKDFKVQFEKRK